ncbi:MAG TPA: RNA polymerase sigma factor [Candidatus Angelobacter sp.]|nr:RNA polymerase sigma factor [Candidatus Angelobacter sp.]
MDRSSQFEKLYRDHQHVVMAVCMRLLKNREDAEEVTQETFFRAWRSFDSFQNKFPRAWLARIARNSCLNRLRDDPRYRHHHVYLDHPPENHQAPDVPGEDGNLQRFEILRDANRNLPGISPQQRTVLLQFARGSSYEEIAKRTGMSHCAVKSALFRARVKMAQLCHRRAA